MQSNSSTNKKPIQKQQKQIIPKSNQSILKPNPKTQLQINSKQHPAKPTADSKSSNQKQKTIKIQRIIQSKSTKVTIEKPRPKSKQAQINKSQK